MPIKSLDQCRDTYSSPSHPRLISMVAFVELPPTDNSFPREYTLLPLSDIKRIQLNGNNNPQYRSAVTKKQTELREYYRDHKADVNKEVEAAFKELAESSENTRERLEIKTYIRRLFVSPINGDKSLLVDGDNLSVFVSRKLNWKLDTDLIQFLAELKIPSAKISDTEESKVQVVPTTLQDSIYQAVHFRPKAGERGDAAMKLKAILEPQGDPSASSLINSFLGKFKKGSLEEQQQKAINHESGSEAVLAYAIHQKDAKVVFTLMVHGADFRKLPYDDVDKVWNLFKEGAPRGLKPEEKNALSKVLFLKWLHEEIKKFKQSGIGLMGTREPTGIAKLEGHLNKFFKKAEPLFDVAKIDKLANEALEGVSREIAQSKNRTRVFRQDAVNDVYDRILDYKNRMLGEGGNTPGLVSDKSQGVRVALDTLGELTDKKAIQKFVLESAQQVIKQEGFDLVSAPGRLFRLPKAMRDICAAVEEPQTSFSKKGKSIEERYEKLVAARKALTTKDLEIPGIKRVSDMIDPLIEWAEGPKGPPITELR